jgi:putative peptidoglycan lipid II flippase
VTAKSHEPSEAPSSIGHAERERIAGRAGVVAAGTLVSRFLGLGRELVLAAMFSRAATDVFMVAFVIPNVMRQLLAEGAVQNAVLPVLAATRETQGEERAREFFRVARGMSLLILTGVSILGVLAAPWLVELFAHGFHQYPGQFERTVTLTRWIFPYILFIGTAALGVAALNIHHRFAITAFAPGLLNVAFIVFGLILPGWFAARGLDPILALAVGVLVGGVLQVAAQWPSLRAIGYGQLPRLDFKHPELREALRRMGPVLIGVGIYYIDVVVARHLLSGFEVGAQSYFGFAMRLCDFPQGIFVMAVQAATLPSLARLATLPDKTELARTFGFGLRLSLFVGLAASALFVALAEPLVALVFERGQFDAGATHETARALMAQGAGIVMVSAVRQLVAVYYAVGDTRTPVIVSAIDLVVFIALALVLRGGFGHVGVSLAMTGASLAQMLLLFVMLRRHLPSLMGVEIGISLLKTALALVPAVFASQGMARWVQRYSASTILPGGAAVLCFGVVFLLAALLLKSAELSAILKPLFRRFAKRASAS